MDSAHHSRRLPARAARRHPRSTVAGVLASAALLLQSANAHYARAEDSAVYPVAGRFGLAAHKRGNSLETAKSVVNDPVKECADAGRWFDFRGSTRLDHFTATPLTFQLRMAKFTPPDTYYLIEGEGIGDSFILHKTSDTAIDIVMTDGGNMFIQLWMVKCG